MLSQTVTVKLGKVGGATPVFEAGQMVTLVSGFIEQVRLFAVGEANFPDTGPATQTITFSSHYPAEEGATVFQGGVQGQYLSFDANLAFSGMRSSYYVLGSLDGVHLIYAVQSGGGTGTTLPMAGDEAATTSGPNSGFHLYPGAEIAAVPPAAGHAPLLEQNNLTFAAGDLVECPHYPVNGGHILWGTKYQVTPTNPSLSSYGVEINVDGPAVTQSFRPRNRAPNSNYQAYGGPVNPPPAIAIDGHFRSILEHDRPTTLPLYNVLGVDAGQPTTFPVLGWANGGYLSYDSANNVIVARDPVKALAGVLLESTDGHTYRITMVGPTLTATLVS